MGSLALIIRVSLSRAVYSFTADATERVSAVGRIEKLGKLNWASPYGRERV